MDTQSSPMTPITPVVPASVPTVCPVFVGLDLTGVLPIETAESLAADFWPDDESVDDLVATVREWRRQGG
jgi:hypothetical protein